MFLSFLSAWMLLGVLLVAIPITIHLLNKAKFSREPWGAMMFLQKAVQIRSRRIKLEQILLMILRCLFLVLLALALARPVSRLGSGSWRDPTTHVLILDHSFSMQQGDGADQAFEKAQDTALRLADNMNDTDNMIVVLAGNKPRDLFPNFSFDKQFIREQVESIEPGLDQIADIPKALEHAFWILKRSPLPRHRIYVITDSQAYGWHTDEEQKWQALENSVKLQKVAPHVYALGQPAKAQLRNLAIDGIRLRSPIVDTHRPVTFMVEVSNYTDERTSTLVEFLVDGKLVASRDLDCALGANIIEFDYSFTSLETHANTTGNRHSSHYVEAHIGEDDIALDNTFSLALQVQHSIPVLLIEGDNDTGLWDSDGGLLSLALTSAGSADRSGLFDVTRRKLHDFDRIDAADFEQYKCIVLVNVPSLSRHQQFSIEQFVERGGGLLVTLGDNVSAAEYNRTNNDGKGMIPAKLTRIVSVEDEPLNPRFPAGAASHILDIFDTSRTRVLTEVRVRKFWECSPAADALGVGFLGDMPFLIYRRYGEGRVALLTTSANAEWTNFPTTQDYLPLIQDLVVYLSASVQPPINIAQNEPLVFVAPPQWDTPTPDSDPDDKAADKRVCRVVAPNAHVDKADCHYVGGKWVMEWMDTTMPGIYTVTVGDSDPVYYAVALQRGEGNLSILDSEARDRAGDTIVTGFVDNLQELRIRIEDEVGAREWWRRLIFLALAVLCLELVLAWRYSK